MFYEAVELFKDAQKYLNPQKDPVMWDLVCGLSKMAQSLRSLEEKVERIQSDVRQLRT